ncbi:hypothetical protein [Legionella sp. km772]|uniref:hypothetical protein n=1 Tax=Legionella sp. km772 TaxID=2498111 RepID=UPI000F8C7E21|nr:hypothetical protein [Legionella sp. km772]RUR12046.1 hypothetical protein ELY15_06275 [Legionella sp. km772]
MRQVAKVVALMMLSPLTFAQATLPPPPPPQPSLVLDKIMFQTSAKQWVSTQSALLNVSIDATLNNADLVKARADIMSNLNKIAKGEWHLLSFDRSQDNSGLEKVNVQAQVRVNQAVLTNIYQNAKSVSIPGAQYTISGIDFKPSLDEVQTVQAAVRKQLYQQVNDELDRINKAYPKQNYTVSNLMFLDGDNPQPPIAYQAKTMNTMMVQASVAPAPLSVSNEIVLTALVEVASNRKPGN